MFATAKSRLIKYFFFGNSIANDGYLRLAYLLGRFLVFLPLSLCATLVLGVYSLFRPVKIFMLRCNRSKISFIVEDLEVALRIEAHKEKNTGVRRPLIFAVLDCESPNRAFTSMYGRIVPFLDEDRPFARGVIRYALPVFRIHRQYLARRQSENQLEIWSTSQPTLSFTKDENRRGIGLQSQVLSDNYSPFVCIGVAEPIYYHIKHNSKKIVETDLDLYSCMPSWENYIACTRELKNHALKTVRVGPHVSKNLAEISDSSIIDYASEMRTEFGDVWLLANCKFVIAGGTGNFWISSALNKPALLTDTYGISNSSYTIGDLAIPQLAWSKSDKDLLPFSWLMAQGEGWGHKKSLINGDIEIIKNTAEEITEAVIEMNQRIDGTWVETDEDIELQERFRELRKAIPQWQVQQSVRIGAAFLRRYKHLL
jgi:putative glycosyltransferase (TIGR04372 family)